MIICPKHKEEYKTVMVQTLAFKEAEAWCPFCGHTAAMPLGEYDTEEDTPQLQEMFIRYKHYAQQYLYAMSTKNGYKVEHEGEKIAPEDLPEEEKERIEKLIESWEYGKRVEEIKQGEVYGMPYTPPEPVICYGCGKNMTNKMGSSYVGFMFGLTIDHETVTPEALEFTKLQWGKYYEDACERKLQFCFECYVTAIMNLAKE